MSACLKQCLVECVNVRNSSTKLNLKPNIFRIAPNFKVTAERNPKITATANASTQNTNLAYLDTASSHILLHDNQPNVTVTTHKPLTVTYPNVSTASSTSSGHLQAGPIAVPVSILDKPNLTHQLLGIAPFTNVGCEAHFTQTSALITKNGQHVLHGTKAPTDNLWTVDINQLPPHGSANLAIRTQSVQERVNYFQCLLGNRPISSVVKALTMNYIRDVEGWPTVTPSQFQTHAKNVPAIAAGHLQEQRQNIASTKIKPPKLSRRLHHYMTLP